MKKQDIAIGDCKDMMNTLKKELDKRVELRKHLFEKGYLITDATIKGEDSYPFYGNWRKKEIKGFQFLTYKTVKLFTFEKKDKVFFLIGHAYNPYTMEYDENLILPPIAEAYETDSYFDLISELTGIFIMGVVSDEKLEFLLDASGMQYGCYGTVDGKQYISSHTALIGDLCSLTRTDYVNRLIHYKWYHYMMGNYLPGDITSYKEIKRIIPNTYVKFVNRNYYVERFYPNKKISMCKNQKEYKDVILQAAQIMRNSMVLIPKKWKKPAISLTGGIDSNTTFAAANGNYEKYTTFSYISMYRESVDAEKAKEISEHFGVPFKEYIVPDKNEEIRDFNVYKCIFEHNDGDIGFSKDNDTRKKITLINSDVCDVEVKSWISETIRAYAYKYFGRTSFPKSLSARNYTSLYKIFLLNRKLVHETDQYFREYLENTQLKEHIYNYDESDFFVWEMMHGGKCGLNIGVMKSCFDITIPYNNRKLLDLLLRVPLKYRISDRHHLDLKKELNQELYNMNIRVVNLNETSRRKRVANLYYIVNSHLPF